ncbi:MAG: MFS transporter [Candidatus Heimdallarchaeaceae archaeon]
MLNDISSITERLHSGKGNQSVNLGVLVSATGIGVFLTSLDQTIVNVSLPAIRSGFNVEQSEVQWVIIVYLLTVIAFTAPFGNLGDRISNKLVFQLGMLVFVAGSSLCFFSSSLLWLILSRILQAIGGSAMVANGIAIIARFTDDTNRGTAIGINSFIISIGIVVGPIIGGLLTQHFGWPYIFLINVPTGLLGLVWVQFAIPATPSLHQGTRKADPIGSISLAGFLTLLVFGLTVLTDSFISHQLLFGLLSLAGSVALFVIFVLWEQFYAHAIIELSLFKNKRYAIGIFSALFAYIGLCVIIFQLPFYLHDILHYSPSLIGIIVLITAVTMAISGVIFGIISNYVDARILTTVGLGGMTISLFLGVILISDHTTFWELALIAFILGVSLGGFISPNSNCVMGAVPKGKEGVSNGLLGLATNVGFAIGTATATAIFSINLKISVRFQGGDPMDIVNYIPATRWLFFGFAIMMLITTIISYMRGSSKALIEISEKK